MKFITRNKMFSPVYCIETIFPVTDEGRIVSSRNNHKIFIKLHFVWRLKSGFTSGYSPSQLQNVPAQKHSHSWYHLNNILGRNSAAKSHSKGPICKSNNKKANMLALPVNKMCLFASMDNAPPETRDIKNIKVNSFPGSSILFSSVI